MKTQDLNRPIVVFSGTTWQSEMVMSLLANADIEAFLKDEIIGTLAPWWAAPGGAGSVSVEVSAKDFDKARLVVNDYEKNLKDSE